MSTEGKDIQRAVVWNAAGLFVTKSVSILAKLILAALLVPEHFGFVGMILVFTQVLKIATDLGLKNALIHHEPDSLDSLRCDSAFWFLIGVAVAAVLLMWIAGVPMIVWFYGVPQLQEIGVAMSFAVLFHNIQVVPEALLARAMKFKRIAAAEFAGTTAGCLTAVGLALAGAGVWSLVAQVLTSALVTAAALLLGAGWLPRLHLAPRLLLELKSYSSYILGSRALSYFQQNLDYLLIGKLIGASAVGIYAIAFLVTETLRSQISWLVARVVFPAFSRMGTDRAKIRSLYLGTVRYTTLTIFPLATMLIVYANDIVRTFFSSAWAGAAEPIRILAMASIVMASAGTPGEVLRGVGKPQTDFRIQFQVSLFVALPALWLGISWWGLPGAALAVLIYYSVSRLLFYQAIRKEIALGGRALLAALRPAVLGSALMPLPELLLSRDPWIVNAFLSVALYSLIAGPVVLAQLLFSTPLEALRRKRAGRSARRTFVLVILGPDGAGKTSLTRCLQDQLPGGSRRLYLGMGLDEPWALNAIRAAYRFHSRQRSEMARRITGSIFWYLLLPIELVARRAKLAVTPPSDLLLVDRLPGRPFLQGGALLRCYRMLLPRADKTVLLVGDPAKIASRKPEQTSAERTRQEFVKWEKVALSLGAGPAIRIDTTDNDLQSCTERLLGMLASTAARATAAAS